ncbi:hypothetical protein C1752_02778 [Acaryochloris thomasi RCC1774]|uniref:Uncharacterized protein n=2 Tax=Acaryochloris TaxID=155977 RepID=A0A2W1JT94_9CYAN|nr:hypothetical protein C1752_02778 [Acaryochloris thomasi RCC1774]
MCIRTDYFQPLEKPYMFNDDFFELKKALERVTLEVTDLKNTLHEKNIEIRSLKLDNNRKDQMLRENNTSDLKQKVVNQDIRTRELTIDKDQAKKKNIQLRGDIQSLNDRIAGLVKENDRLKREAIARQVMTKTFNGVKGLVDKVKSK